MTIDRLTQQNIGDLAFPCALRKSRWIRHPQLYRDKALAYLQTVLDRHIFGYIAVDGTNPVGQILVSPIRRAGVPVQSVRINVLAVLCTWIDHKRSRQKIGCALIDAAADGFPDAAGLLVVDTHAPESLPVDVYHKLGFQPVSENVDRSIVYFPITESSVDVDFYTPKLEWDHVKPFTFIRRDVCPFMIQLSDTQRRVAGMFHDLLPTEEIPYEDARIRSDTVIPGFYVYGKRVPADITTARPLKRYIRQAIRDESRKMFGTAARPHFEQNL